MCDVTESESRAMLQWTHYIKVCCVKVYIIIHVLQSLLQCVCVVLQSLLQCVCSVIKSVTMCVLCYRVCYNMCCVTEFKGGV